jgi:hypothetical protein
MTDDLCHLCDYHNLVNEARDAGAETWRAPPDEYGVSVFVIPPGVKPNVRLQRDNTYGSQRKAWYNEIPEECECGEEVQLKHPPSGWQPEDAATAAPEPEPESEPEPVFIPPTPRGPQREALSLV